MYLNQPRSLRSPSKKPLDVHLSNDSTGKVKDTQDLPPSPLHDLFPDRQPVRAIVRAMQTGSASERSSQADVPATTIQISSPTPPTTPANRSRPSTPAENAKRHGPPDPTRPAVESSRESQSKSGKGDTVVKTAKGTSRSSVSPGMVSAQKETTQHVSSSGKPRTPTPTSRTPTPTSRTSTPTSRIPTPIQSATRPPSAGGQAPPASPLRNTSPTGPASSGKPITTRENRNSQLAKVPSGASQIAAARPPVWQESDSSVGDELLLQTDSPASYEFSPQESSPDAKSLDPIPVLSQDSPRPYLSESSEPPNSPLPPLPQTNATELPKPQSYPMKEGSHRLSRQLSNDFPGRLNTTPRAARNSLIRSNTPDILTRRTSQDRANRTPNSGSVSTLPSRQLSLKLPVNPHNGFSRSGRVSPAGRSSTPDAPERRQSQDRLSRSPSTLAERDSAGTNRVSLEVPARSHSSVSQSGRISPLMRSNTPDVLRRSSSRLSNNTTLAPIEFLAAIAAQERFIMELKEEQEQAEIDLESLKREWATQDHYSKQDILKQVEELIGSVEKGHSSHNFGTKEPERRADHTPSSSPQVSPPSQQDSPSDPTASGEVKVRQRTVFQSREMRPLSLLSPNNEIARSRSASPKPGRSPRAENVETQVDEKREPNALREAVVDNESESDIDDEVKKALKERSDALSIIQEEASTKSIKHDSMPQDVPPLPTSEDLMRTSWQVSSDIREGLQTFIHDLKQANVAEKQPTSSDTKIRQLDSTPAPLPRKTSRMQGPRETNRSVSPSLQLRTSGSLKRTKVVDSQTDLHRSVFVDLDNDLFESDLWKGSMFTPLSSLPSNQDKPVSMPRRRYLNLESDENLPVQMAERVQQISKRVTKSPSQESISTGRGSISSDHSNRWSSTISTHEDAPQQPKRASSPLLIASLPAPSNTSLPLNSSKSNTTVKPMMSPGKGGSRPHTPLKDANRPPTRSRGDKDSRPETGGRVSETNQPTRQTPSEDNPRLLSPRGQEHPSQNSHLFSSGFAPRLKKSASNLKQKLERNKSDPRRSLSTDRPGSGKKKKAKESSTKSDLLSSPPRQKYIPIPSSAIALPPQQDPLPMSPASTIPRRPATAKNSVDGRASNYTTKTSNTNKDLPPLPPGLAPPKDSRTTIASPLSPQNNTRTTRTISSSASISSTSSTDRHGAFTFKQLSKLGRRIRKMSKSKPNLSGE